MDLSNENNSFKKFVKISVGTRIIDVTYWSVGFRGCSQELIVFPAG